MTINEMIQKFKLELAEQNGVKGFKMNVKPTTQQIEMLRSAKPQIMVELEKIEEEKMVAREQRRSERESEIKIETEKYITSANLKRCLVRYFEDMKFEYYIVTLQMLDGRAYQTKYKVGKLVELPYTTKTILELASTEGIGYGLGGIAWEITEEQENVIVEEKRVAKIETEKAAEIKKVEDEKIETAKKIEREEKRKSIFDAAKETGEKQLLISWSDDCDDPCEECDVDIIYEYAMPDGTVQIERHHTW